MEPKFHASPADMPPEAREYYKKVDRLNQKLHKVIRSETFDVGANAMLNLIIGAAIHGDKKEREGILVILEQTAEYIRRLDLQAPSGTTVN